MSGWTVNFRKKLRKQKFLNYICMKQLTVRADIFFCWETTEMSKQAENCHRHHALKNRPRKNNSVFLEKSIFGIYYSPGKKSKLLVEFYFQLFFEFTVHSLEKPKYFLIFLLLFTQSTCQNRSTGRGGLNSAWFWELGV